MASFSELANLSADVVAKVERSLAGAATRPEYGRIAVKGEMASFHPHTLPSTLREPSYSDPLVSDASSLLAEIRRAQRVSIRLSGRILLGSLPLDEFGNLIDIVSRGQSVTLWSSEDEGASLDGEGMGRVLEVWSGGQVLLQNVWLTGGRTIDGGGCAWVQNVATWLVIRGGGFFNCSTSGQDGGGMVVAGGTVITDGTVFEDCTVRRANGGNARGGGLSIQVGEIFLNGTSFVETRTYNSAGGAYGGGIALWGAGPVVLRNVSFVRTSVTTEHPSSHVFGGGFAAFSGTSELQNVSFINTSVVSLGKGRAYGGAVGMNAGHASLYDCSIEGSTVHGGRAAYGGGVGSPFGGTMALNGVRLSHTSVSAPAVASGSALYSLPNQLVAAHLSLRQSCGEGEAGGPRAGDENATSLIGTEGAGGLLLRSLTVDAPGCQTLDNHTSLLQCADVEHACGAAAICTDSDDAAHPTPICACAANDPHLPFVEWVPSDEAQSTQLAP